MSDENLLGPWTEHLSDGTPVLIRSIHKDDELLERKFIEELSPESQRFRFLSAIKIPSPALIKQLTDIDHERDVAFIALVEHDGKQQEIGVSRYSLDADGQACECAVVVGDQWRTKGLATTLMHHLIEVARARGLKRMYSIDTVDNTNVRQLGTHLGFHRKLHPDDAALAIHTLDL